jgi:FemAB family
MGGRLHAEVDTVTQAEWCVLMEQFDDANIYQTWAYGAVRWQEKNLSHLILKHENEVLGMAQLRILRPANLPCGVGYLRWGPLCHKRGRELDVEIMQAMALALREEYVTKRRLYLEILPNAFSGTLRGELFRSAFLGFDQKSGISKEKYRTFLLDLSPSLEDLRKKLDKKWRNQLNAASRNNLEIVEGSDIDTYREFCGLYQAMWQRKQFYSAVNIDEFHQVQQRLPQSQRLKILICRHERKAVAAVVCSALGNSAIYLLGATNEDGMKLKASYLLQWRAIESAKERGNHFYDLGGIDPVSNPGVYHFKSGISGADVSHIGALVACESRFSASLVRAGQAVRNQLRALRRETRVTPTGATQ